MAARSQLVAWLCQSGAARSYGLFSSVLSRTLLFFFKLGWRVKIQIPYMYLIASMMLNIRLQVHIEIH
ncbi:Hypothetical predicted protein [Pelobates cultripes]|uniref:Small integral membrane protein 10 n=1 Tax=Pelobates cultripes TaxID=61616 RepID=A0AAD1WIR6_PELCU|nr:Hypothetical predicted protein [Pelobates cultripes]